MTLNTKEEVIEFKNDLPTKVPEYIKEIEALKEKYSGLSLTDVNDKKQLALIKSARIEFKNARIGVEKYCKSVRDGANAFSKAVIAKEKEIVALIEPEETRLEQEEAKYEAEQQRLAEIKRKAEEEKFNSRVLTLSKMGFKLTDRGYELFGCVATSTEINLMDEMAWVKFLEGEANAAYELEQTEIKRKEKEEEERKAEEERIKSENEKLRKEESERLERQRKEQEEEKKRLEAAQAEQLKKEEELAARERELQRIENERIAAEKKKADESKRAKELEEAKTKAAEEERKRLEKEAKDREAAEAMRKKKEAEKLARQPDKKKLQLWAGSIETFSVPELKSPEAKVILDEAIKKLMAVKDYVNTQTETL